MKTSGAGGLTPVFTVFSLTAFFGRFSPFPFSVTADVTAEVPVSEFVSVEVLVEEVREVCEVSMELADVADDWAVCSDGEVAKTDDETSVFSVVEVVVEVVVVVESVVCTDVEEV